MGRPHIQRWPCIGAMNQGFVRGMFVKGMSLIPLTLIPLTVRFMESSHVHGNAHCDHESSTDWNAGLGPGSLDLVVESRRIGERRSGSWKGGLSISEPPSLRLSPHPAAPGAQRGESFLAGRERRFARCGSHWPPLPVAPTACVNRRNRADVFDATPKRWRRCRPASGTAAASRVR